MASTSSSTSSTAGPRPTAGDEDFTGYDDYVMVDEVDVEEKPSGIAAGGEEEEELAGDEAKCPVPAPAPPRPASPLAATRKAPGLLRIFVLPEDHELAFDFFSGVPTLHARPCPSSYVRFRGGRLLPPPPPPPPPQAAGLPSRVDFRPFVTGHRKDDYQVFELLFWAPPPAADQEERKGFVAIPAFRPPAKFATSCVWRARLALATFSLMADQLCADAAAAGGGGAGGRRPLFFTFSPDVVVLYGRWRKWLEGNSCREISMVMIAGEDYHELVWRSRNFWRHEAGFVRQNVVGALTAGAAIF